VIGRAAEREIGEKCVFLSVRLFLKCKLGL
jgi:hypothetical protein